MSPRANRAARRVLVTDAGERSMVATCRGLQAAGYEVAAAAYGPLAPSHWSRACSERLRVTDPRVDAGAFVADLRAHLRRRSYAALVPGSDFSLFAVSRGRGELDGLTRLGLPSHENVRRGLDRQVLATAAAGAGLYPAAAIRCASAEEALVAARELTFPVLLKSISTVRERGSAVTLGSPTLPVGSESELRAAAASYGDAFIVQRAEAGRTLSLGGVIAEGRLLAVAASVYLRTWPPSAGNVAFSMTIDAGSELERTAASLLQAVGWEGIFELEMIQRPDGTLVPIDLNPRPYGSMALAVAAGANLPGIWCDWGLDGRAEPLRAARPGQRYRWEDGDLKHMLWQLRHGNYRAATRALRPWRGVAHPHFQASDPLPLVARGLSLVAGKVRPARG